MSGRWIREHERRLDGAARLEGRRLTAVLTLAGAAGLVGLRLTLAAAGDATASEPSSCSAPITCLGRACNVSESPVVASRQPSLAVTANGSVHLAWEEGPHVYHRFLVQGQGWSVARPAWYGCSSPVLTSVGAESVALACVGVHSGRPAVFLMRWNLSDRTGCKGAWSPADRQDITTDAKQPALALSATDGSLHMTWVQGSGIGAGDLYHGFYPQYATRAPGFHGRPLRQEQGLAPSTAVADDGGVLVSWQWYPPGQSQPRAIMLRQASPPVDGVLDWQQAALYIRPPSDGTTSMPRLLVEGEQLFVSWQEEVGSYGEPGQSGGGAQDVMLAWHTQPRAQGWGDWRTNNVSRSAADSVLPALAIDYFGAMWVGWQESNSGSGPQEALSTKLIVRREPPPREEAAVVPDGVDGISRLNPVMATGPGGELHLAWVERAGTDTNQAEVWYAPFTPRETFYVPLATNP